MPLINSSTKKAFRENVAEMRHAGHPLGQSLAVAYKTSREAQRDTHQEREEPRHFMEALKYGK